MSRKRCLPTTRQTLPWTAIEPMSSAGKRSRLVVAVPLRPNLEVPARMQPLQRSTERIKNRVDETRNGFHPKISYWRRTSRTTTASFATSQDTAIVTAQSAPPLLPFWPNANVQRSSRLLRMAPKTPLRLSSRKTPKTAESLLSGPCSAIS